MNELALFAGAGGGILGGKLLGWRTVCAVEWEPYPASVLCARQNDGFLPPFPIWDDVQTFDGKPWRGIVDVVSGGFPCQDISAAGKGAGIDGERSGMWGEMARIIHEVRPKFVFVENSPMLTSRGLGRVLGDLASMGFDARWGVLGAADVGANHQRDRIWIVGKATNSTSNRSQKQANQRVMESQGRGELQLVEPRNTTEMGNSNNYGQIAAKVGAGIVKRGDICETRPQQASESARPSEQYAELAHTNISQCQGVQQPKRNEQEYSYACGSSWWQVEPDVGRVADGLADRVDRLKAIGNGQVPLCAATAWRVLSELL